MHIPFCVRKCRYCDFLSFPTEKRDDHSFVYQAGEIRKEYLRSLTEEMKLQAATGTGAVDTIFIGGGTPSVLLPGEIDSVFCGLHRHFELGGLREFTIECNPGTVTEEKLLLYRKAGVNRLSFGLQSAVDAELKQLGRIHTFRDFLESYELARRVGFDNINIDIMFSIPKQTKESYDYTLSQVVALSPEHISAYSLIIEEGTPFYEKYADNPPVDEETDRFLYERTKEVLTEAGYNRYEISNYSLRGRESRHNLKYWQREEYVGIGLGAASCVCSDERERRSDSYKERSGRYKRYTNVSDPGCYCDMVSKKRLPIEEHSVEFLSQWDEMAEFMYLGLRCMEGVSMERFADCFGVPMMVCYGREIISCEKQGLLRQKDGFVCLTERGIDVSNRVFAEFIRETPLQSG